MYHRWYIGRSRINNNLYTQWTASIFGLLIF